MTITAPNRGDRNKVSADRGRNGERPVQSSRDQDRKAWNKAVMLLNVLLIAGVAIIGLSHIHSGNLPDRAAVDPTGGPASTLPDTTAAPSQAATQEPSEQPTTEPTATPSSPELTSATDAPKVTPTMRTNFAKGDPWPVGAGFRETGDVSWPLGVVDRLMTHGPPTGPDAVSWLEKWMKTDVRRIGARVLFAPNHSGSAAITAWHTSILDTSGLQQPRTGMRLVVEPGRWRLMALDAEGASVIDSGQYVQVGHAGTFDMVRRNGTVWITDPTGFVTRVDDKRIERLSGPWASWELREDKAGTRPAGLQEIWAA